MNTSPDTVRIAGRCHCGNIAFELAWPRASVIPARACSCSFCVKHGGVWTSNPNAALTVRVDNPASVSRYAFGTGTAIFHVCSRCGVVPLVTSTIADRLYAVVNVNALDDAAGLEVTRAAASFDGESVQARLQRRQRNWIADVQIIETNSAR